MECDLVVYLFFIFGYFGDKYIDMFYEFFNIVYSINYINNSFF